MKTELIDPLLWFPNRDELLPGGEWHPEAVEAVVRDNPSMTAEIMEGWRTLQGLMYATAVAQRNLQRARSQSDPRSHLASTTPKLDIATAATTFRTIEAQLSQELSDQQARLTKFATLVGEYWRG